MINVRGNFKNQYTSESLFCQGCMMTDKMETQHHIYSCLSLSSSDIIINTDDDQYQDLFGEDLDKQIRVSAILKKRLEVRQEIISKRENSLNSKA